MPTDTKQLEHERSAAEAALAQCVREYAKERAQKVRLQQQIGALQKRLLQSQVRCSHSFVPTQIIALGMHAELRCVKLWNLPVCLWCGAPLTAELVRYLLSVKSRCCEV